MISEVELTPYYFDMDFTGRRIFIVTKETEIDHDSGKKYVKGYLPFERLPVNRKEMEQSLENVNYYYSGMENIVRRKLLAHEPCYWNVILDENRLWVQLARSDKSKPNWIITSLDSEVLESFYGPDEITGVTIRGN